MKKLAFLLLLPLNAQAQFLELGVAGGIAPFSSSKDINSDMVSFNNGVHYHTVTQSTHNLGRTFDFSVARSFKHWRIGVGYAPTHVSYSAKDHDTAYGGNTVGVQVNNSNYKYYLGNPIMNFHVFADFTQKIKKSEIAIGISLGTSGLVDKADAPQTWDVAQHGDTTINTHKFDQAYYSGSGYSIGLRLGYGYLLSKRFKFVAAAEYQYSKFNLKQPIGGGAISPLVVQYCPITVGIHYLINKLPDNAPVKKAKH